MMLKRLLGVGCFAAAMAFSTASANALAVWRGVVKVASATPQCELGFVFFAAGEEKNIFFLPASLSNNGPDTVLSFGTDAYFVSMKVIGGGVSTGATHQTTAIDPFGNQTSSGGTFLSGAFSPATFDASTKLMNFTFRISNAGGQTGCTVVLRGSLLRAIVN